MLTVMLVGCATTQSNSEIIELSTSGLLDGTHAYKSGIHAYKHGHLDRAASKFQLAIEKNPENGAAHNNLGLVLFEQRKLPQAAEHFDLAAELMPTDPIPVNNLGMALEAGGRVFDAIEYYAAAASMAPDNALYLGNWVRARVRLGEQGPGLIEDLQRLAFVETRPDWVAWTDEQLAIFHNPMLDRGPATNAASDAGPLELDHANIPPGRAGEFSMEERMREGVGPRSQSGDWVEQQHSSELPPLVTPEEVIIAPYDAPWGSDELSTGPELIPPASTTPAPISPTAPGPAPRG